MNEVTALWIYTVYSSILNWVCFFSALSFKRGKLLSIVSITAYTYGLISLYSINGTSPLTSTPGLTPVLMLPLYLFLVSGTFFQKLFAFFLQWGLTLSQLYIVNMTAESLMLDKNTTHYLFILISIFILHTANLLVALKFGKQLFVRLFQYGTQSVWALYTVGAVFSYLMIVISHIMIDIGWLHTVIILFANWNFCVLCFAIINVHEGTKRKIEAEFSKSIISAGQEHYRHINEMYEKLRILRHDYKYHLGAVRRMIQENHSDQADQYLTVVEEQLDEHDAEKYCLNTVINALISSYAKRCANNNIQFDVKLDIPETLHIPEYDMCVIIGNLLENAEEACKRYQANHHIISVESKNDPSQLLIMVRNSYDGLVTMLGDMPVSLKGSGFGIKSVKEVLSRHNGDLVIDANEHFFSVYVAIKG